MGRPRKTNVKRKPSGKIKYQRRKARAGYYDSKEFHEAKARRMALYGVDEREASSPLSSFLVGRLYLQDRLDLVDVGHFYAFITCMPQIGRAIVYSERVMGGKLQSTAIPFRTRYWDLITKLGNDLHLLNALANDQLLCSINRIKLILSHVPLTDAAYNYMLWAERHRPR